MGGDSTRRNEFDLVTMFLLVETSWLVSATNLVATFIAELWPRTIV